MTGYTQGPSGCLPVAGTPASHTQAEVCAAWTASRVLRAGGDGFSKSTATCDPGTLTRDAIDDALARLNFHRWLAGLGPTVDDATDNDAAQKCSLVSAWNPAGSAAHSPPSTATCYTPEGAAGAGSSNIAWGSTSAAGAIDQWMIDNGNETTFGHRRWLVSPPLSPVGIGFYRGGNNYGTASCIRVFSGAGAGPFPAWTAFPPPGFVPSSIAAWPWTVHGAFPRSPQATVTRLSDGVDLAVTVQALSGNYGNQAAILLQRSSWSPAVGETYRVVISGVGASVEYEVKPVACP